MTTGQEAAVDQRLDQHSEAMEVVLDKIDELERRARTLHRQGELFRRRIRELETIILPAADKPGSARPSQTPP